MKRQFLQKILAVLTLAVLAAAWFAGSARVKDAESARIRAISPEITDIRKVGEDLYIARRAGSGEASHVPFTDQLYIAIDSHPGYAGPVQVAVVVNAEGRIEQVAVLHSTDTRTYIAKIVDSGLLDAFLNRNIGHMPKVDAISGATLSSGAVISAVNRAAALIGGTWFDRPLEPEKTEINPRELAKAAAVLLFFAVALLLSLKRFPLKSKWLRLGLLAASVVVLGFMHGTQFSLSTIALFLSGFWVKGVGSYAPLLCLILAVLVFFATKKNLYCAAVCPFGALQECLGRISNCPPPPVSAWMQWIARALALAAICAALYFRTPSDASYEPFGRTFNFIGSGALFALSILIIVTSLLFKRPWCRLLCPMTPLFDYFRFMRSWLAGGKKSARPDGKEAQ